MSSKAAQRDASGTSLVMVLPVWRCRLAVLSCAAVAFLLAWLAFPANDLAKSTPDRIRRVDPSIASLWAMSCPAADKQVHKLRDQQWPRQNSGKPPVVSKLVYINMEWDHARRQYMERQFHNLSQHWKLNGHVDADVSWHRQPGMKASVLQKDPGFANWRQKGFSKSPHPKVKGDWRISACAYSHYAAISNISEDPSSGLTMITEDDVEVELDFPSLWNELWPWLPEEWDVLRVGWFGDHVNCSQVVNSRIQIAAWQDPPNGDCMYCGAQAYIVNPKSKRAVMQRFEKSRMTHADELLGAPTPLAEDLKVVPPLKVFVVMPMLAHTHFNTQGYPAFQSDRRIGRVAAMTTPAPQSQSMSRDWFLPSTKTTTLMGSAQLGEDVVAMPDTDIGDWVAKPPKPQGVTIGNQQFRWASQTDAKEKKQITKRAEDPSTPDGLSQMPSSPQTHYVEVHATSAPSAVTSTESPLPSTATTMTTSVARPLAVTASTTNALSDAKKIGEAGSTVETTTTTTYQCWEDRTAYEPMDMPEEGVSTEADTRACQERCARTVGCAHFSYWKEGGFCHLQDSYAVRVTSRYGFISGPFRCWDFTNDQNNYDDSYLPVEFSCMETGAAYFPPMVAPRVFPESVAPRHRDAVIACQRHCASVQDCEHFTIEFPLRVCKLTSRDARRLYPIVNAMSGPPQACMHEAAQLQFRKKFASTGNLGSPKWHAVFGARSIIGGLIAVAVAGIGLRSVSAHYRKDFVRCTYWTRPVQHNIVEDFDADPALLRMLDADLSVQGFVLSDDTDINGDA